MIYLHSNATQTRWDRGGYKVQLSSPDTSRPIGFCDGTEDDMSELRSLAETEASGELWIDKKILKSGREIWTLHRRE